MEIDVAVDVAPIIENYAAETALQRNRKSRLRVHNRQHLPANRHANQAARGSISRITAHRYRPRGTRSIHGETRNRTPPPRKKAPVQGPGVSAKGRGPRAAERAFFFGRSGFAARFPDEWSGSAAAYTGVQ